MNKKEEITKIAISTVKFINARVKNLSMNDDDKLRTIMNVTAMTASIFINSLFHTTNTPHSHLLRDLNQTIEAILNQIKHKDLN